MKRLAFGILLPCLIIAWVLLTSHGVWEEHWVTPMRGAGHSSRDADGFMICLAVLPLAYAVTLSSWFRGMLGQGGGNMTSPSPEEASIAAVLAQVGVTIVAYIFAYIAWVHR
jgi:hypothetical protein